MSKATASTTTSTRDVMTRVEGMAVGMGVAVAMGKVVGVGKVPGMEEVEAVEEVAAVREVAAVGEVVETVGTGVPVVEVEVGKEVGVMVVTVEPLIYCSLLHREQRLMV